MPSVDAVIECPVYDSFRVQQVAGMFDVPLEEKVRESFHVELPGRDEAWQIGLIVGPSGSGKTTVARQYFGDEIHSDGPWPTDRAVIDGFGQLSTKEITSLLTAVGFSSPPSWVKPYHVLSRGEQFRCDLARALSRGSRVEGREQSLDSRPSTLDPLVVYDEFTSVVDRNVARICSAAISKGIRRGHIPCRFVAVTCHRDVADWLEADWVLDMASGTLTRRRLRRPRIELEIFRCGLRAWDLFKRHHYLSGTLAATCRAFIAIWQGAPVAFCATLPVIGRRHHRRFTRIVTLPDYQGVGIGMRMVEAVAQLHRQEGHRINVTSSHPALIAHARRSPRWRTVRVSKSGSSRADRFIKGYHASTGRAVVSFEYISGKRGSKIGQGDK